MVKTYGFIDQHFRNLFLSAEPPFRAGEEIFKSLGQLLKYKIKMENETNLVIFFKKNYLGKHKKNCPKVTKWRSLME